MRCGQDELPGLDEVQGEDVAACCEELEVSHKENERQGGLWKDSTHSDEDSRHVQNELCAADALGPTTDAGSAGGLHTLNSV